MHEGFIDNLRKKPHHVRERILWATIVPVWLVIFVLWVGALFGTSMEVYEDEEPGTVSPASALLGAVGTFGEDFKHRWTGDVEQFADDAKGVMSDIETVKALAPSPGLEDPVGAEILGAFEEIEIGNSEAQQSTTTATTLHHGE